MKTVALSALAALVLSTVTSAHAQSGGQTGSITSNLNRAPATAQTPPAPQPAQPRPTSPAPTQTLTGPTASRQQPLPSPQPQTTEAAPAVATTAPPPPAPAPVPLTAAQIAALPFTLTLPAGMLLVEGRSNDTFNLYTVRRATGPALVTIYAGERSDYPIYGGREVTAGGRTSVIVNEGQGDRAMEHIFLRGTAPREVHIWVGSVDDADRALAEAIAQSVDIR